MNQQDAIGRNVDVSNWTDNNCGLIFSQNMRYFYEIQRHFSTKLYVIQIKEFKFTGIIIIIKGTL